ncbi:MAG: aminotransferase class I/II-fold pyridoxal phosphate-dependent enzyme [Micrococcales bacterium]|nr:aminotransferase class I/II-fold pyridoxal phosphate-dependent enzyme [Micrococcales bacterium]
MPDRLVSRMRSHERTIFGEMSALAARLEAINLGQGFPDTGGPPQVRQVASARSGRVWAISIPGSRLARPASGDQRTPGPVLRPAGRRGRRSGRATGASEGDRPRRCSPLVEPGADVMVLDPYFDLYGAVISLAGARRIAVPLVADTLRPDVAAMSAALTANTRLLLLNSPHNPTGIVFTQAELSANSEFARANDLLVIADEAYEHLWFDNNRHIPDRLAAGDVGSR